jgi:hypothetical protein
MDSVVLVAKYHGARNVVVESEALMPSNFFQMVRAPEERKGVGT